MKLQVKCDFCHKPFMKYECKITPHNFCCRECMARFSSKTANPEAYTSLKNYSNIGKHFSEMNRQLNPTRMNAATRAKLRDSRMNTGDGKSYSKYYGKHTHRIVAERMLDRPLYENEVVHHIDGNKRNNEEWNLLILPSQSEHARLHIREKKFWMGGDAE